MKIDALEAKLDVLNTAELEVKLDDGTRYTDDAELVEHETKVIAEVDANEVKIDAVEAKLDVLNTAALEVKLDDGTRYTDDAELAEHGASVIAEVDGNEVKIDALEVKMDNLDTDLGDEFVGMRWLLIENNLVHKLCPAWM